MVPLLTCQISLCSLPRASTIVRIANMVLIRNPPASKQDAFPANQPCQHRLWTQWHKSQAREAFGNTLPTPPLNDEGRVPLGKLRWSAAEGCQACSLIVDALEEWSPHRLNAGEQPSLEFQIYSHSYRLPSTGKRHVITLRIWEGHRHQLLWLLRKPQGM
jgi:hypothetical protein